MTEAERERYRTVLESSRKLFEQPGDNGLHTVLVSRPGGDERWIIGWADETELGSTDHPLPLGRRLDHHGDAIRGEELPHHPGLLRRLFYYGDHGAWLRYKKIAHPLGQTLRGLLASLGVQSLDPRLQDVLKDAEKISQYGGDLACSSHDAIWTEAVHALLEIVDQGRRQYAEQWIGPEEDDWSPSPLLPQVAGLEHEGIAVARHGVMSHTLHYDAYVSSRLAIDVVLELIAGSRVTPRSGNPRLASHPDPSNPHLVFDGTTYPITRAQALYIKAMIDANGSPVSFSKVLSEFPEEFKGRNSSRVLDGLPNFIQELIERPGKGKPVSLRAGVLS